jgi:hypothetical protein
MLHVRDVVSFEVHGDGHNGKSGSNEDFCTQLRPLAFKEWLLIGSSGWLTRGVEG